MRLLKNILNIVIFLDIILLTNLKLLFVNVHFRHGARGALYLIDKEGNDMFLHKWKKRGMLTAKGKRQVFLNGIKHRERYLDFLSKEYSEDEIKAYSTDSYRAISSLECYLNGLYDNIDSNENIINDKLTIYPKGNITENMKNKVNQLGIYGIPKDNHIIPINIFQKSEHSFVLHEPGKISDCQSITNLRKNMLSEKSFKELFEKFNNKFGEKLQNFFKSKNITNFEYKYDKINLLCDSFYCDMTDNRDMSTLEKEGIKLEELNEFCMNILSFVQKDVIAGNNDIVMMSQTPPVKKLIKWIDERIKLDKEGKTDEIIGGAPKFTIWSGHDSSISTFQMFMSNIFGTKWNFPVFSSSIIIELHKNIDVNVNKNNYELLYYVNDELLLKIDYYKFKKEVNEYFWSDEEIERFCNFSIINVEKMNKIIKKYKWIIVILTLAFCISIFLNIRYFFKNRGKQKEN